MLLTIRCIMFWWCYNLFNYIFFVCSIQWSLLICIEHAFPLISWLDCSLTHTMKHLRKAQKRQWNWRDLSFLPAVSSKWNLKVVVFQLWVAGWFSFIWHKCCMLFLRRHAVRVWIRLRERKNWSYCSLEENNNENNRCYSKGSDMHAWVLKLD